MKILIWIAAVVFVGFCGSLKAQTTIKHIEENRKQGIVPSLFLQNGNVVQDTLSAFPFQFRQEVIISVGIQQKHIEQNLQDDLYKQQKANIPIPNVEAYRKKLIENLHKNPSFKHK